MLGLKRVTNRLVAAGLLCGVAAFASVRAMMIVGTPMTSAANLAAMSF